MACNNCVILADKILLYCSAVHVDMCIEYVLGIRPMGSVQLSYWYYRC